MKKTLLEDINYFDAQVVEEGEGKSKAYYLLLNGMVADKININDRMYSLGEVEKALVPYIEDVKDGLGSALMLADHPVSGTVPSIKDAAGLIKEVTLADKTVKLKTRILETIQGNNILAIAKAGGKVGVSSRALGSLKDVTENGKTYQEVHDLKLKGFDFVLFPSLGADATSTSLVYEHIQAEIMKMFPTLASDITELKESIQSIQERIAVEDLDKIKGEILESITKLASCGCQSGVSDVLINKNDSGDISTLENKEELNVMKTIQEFMEKYPELYKEFSETITKDVTTKVTTEVTEAVTKAVTEMVTKEVSETVATEVKANLEKEITEANAKKDAEIAAGKTAVEESAKKITELETEITSLKESTKPYIDILEGLVTFMRDNKILIAEAEVLSAGDKKDAAPVVAAAVVEDEASKTLQTEMTAIINEQKTKLEEALARITALEGEKTKLEEAKAVAEAEKAKAELSNAVSDILNKEPKYASILKPKLEAATTLEDVAKIYEAEKTFIASIEKLNTIASDIPTGDGKVAEAEVVKDEKVAIVEGEKKDTVITESMTSDDKMAALKAYQRRLAGIK